nr:UvrD-helicase domain-containing protein [Tardiphaga robiniae]
MRSEMPLVLIEAPAGCGKTHQGAIFAAETAARNKRGRLLILTHTHAARSVFAGRTKSGSVSIRTIDSFLTEIATAYHAALDLPLDVGRWARESGGYDDVARRCRQFLEGSSMVASMLADRHPWIVCDEHQDASEDQHRAIMAIHSAGARVRVFGDPMQMIFAKTEKEIQRNLKRWEDLKARGVWGELEHPHRWHPHSPELGEWVLQARHILRDGGSIDLTGRLPRGLAVHIAENSAPIPRNSMSMTAEHRAPINALTRRDRSLLVLASGNERVEHLNGFFGRSMPIWEGHTRDHLTALITCVRSASGDVGTISDGLLDFVYATTARFSASSHGNRLKAQIENGCSKRARGATVHLQVMARHLIDEPDHRGIAKVLLKLTELVRAKEEGFAEVALDLKSEIREAIQIGRFLNADEGFAEVSRRRSFTHPKPAPRSLSTVHKSKGLECDHALMMLCDKQSFSNSLYKRRVFYVGISRAKKALALVISRNDPVPFLSM